MKKTVKSADPEVSPESAIKAALAPLLDVAGACEVLGLSRARVIVLAGEGRIASAQVFGRLFLLREQVQAFSRIPRRSGPGRRRAADAQVVKPLE